jgi:hypothetical protein
MKIRLVTRDGGHVRDGEIPPLLHPPEVITWGSRAFVRFTQDVRTGLPQLYVEGLAYPLDVADQALLG